MKILKTAILLIILLPSYPIYAQAAYQHINDENIYNFTDNPASLHSIDANTAIKPYNREQIAKWLTEADEQKEHHSNPEQAGERMTIFA